MALVKRGLKNSPISATEYDAVVTQVESNLDSISVLNGAFNDSEVTLSFVDLAAATSYWNAASVKPINNVVLYLQDVKTFYKWDSTNANKAITTGRFYVEGEATPTSGSTKFVFSKDVKIIKDTLQNNIDAEATARENADDLKLDKGTFVGNANTLQSNITAEQNRALEKEDDLQIDLDNESMARIAADDLKVDKVSNKSLILDTEIARLASMTAVFTTALKTAYDTQIFTTNTLKQAMYLSVTHKQFRYAFRVLEQGGTVESLECINF